MATQEFVSSASRSLPLYTCTCGCKVKNSRYEFPCQFWVEPMYLVFLMSTHTLEYGNYICTHALWVAVYLEQLIIVVKIVNCESIVELPQVRLSNCSSECRSLTSRPSCVELLSQLQTMS